MFRILPKSFPALGLIVLFGVFSACDGNSPSSPNGSGRLSVELTDAPTDEVSEVNVFVTGLTIKPSDGPVVRIANEIGLIDLLTLQGTTEELVTLGVEAGEYEFIQVDLDQERSNVVELDSGDTVPLQISSEEVKVLSGFTIPLGGDTTVTLDFDAEASLRQLGNGDWLLTPVITRVEAP